MISSLNFKPHDKGFIKGFFDLRYHGMTIRGCRLMSGSNGLWVAYLQQKGEVDGEVKYFDQLYLTPPEADHVRKLVLADLQAQGHIDGQASTGSTQRPSPGHRTHRQHGQENLSEYRSQPEADDGDVPF